MASRYRFGSREYIEHTLAISPVVAKEAEAQTGVSASRRYWNGMSRDLLAQVTALGSAGGVFADKQYEVVTIILREKGMPVDGDMELVFFVDKETLDIVFVLRLLLG